MTRNEMFEYARSKGHQVVFTRLVENEALSAEIDGNCYIGINKDLPETDETELLAHELGHCEYAGFYSILTPLNTRARIEYRARKWQFIKLVPLGKLREAIRKGITAPWDLADYFGVTEHFIYDACEYYTNACGAILEKEVI